MKKVLSCCLGFFVLAGVALFFGVQSMPSEYEITRTKVVSGTPEEVFAIAADLHTWPDWTAWSRDLDPSCVWDWSGPPSAVGSTMNWKGEVHGQGSLTLTAADPGKLIAYKLTFIEEGDNMESTGKLALSPSGQGTEVTWTMNGEIHGVWKLMTPLMEGMVGPMFETGLMGLDARLKGEGSE